MSRTDAKFPLLLFFCNASEACSVKKTNSALGTDIRIGNCHERNVGYIMQGLNKNVKTIC